MKSRDAKMVEEYQRAWSSILRQLGTRAVWNRAEVMELMSRSLREAMEAKNQ